MYDPSGNAREKQDPGVRFVETEPSDDLFPIVHRWLSLQTVAPLPQEYRFHALPDACTYLIFDQLDPSVCGVTRLRATSRELTLGHRFHFTNVRLLPGVWLGEAAIGLVETPYVGPLPLREFARRLHGRPFEEQIPILAGLIGRLRAEGLIEPNPTIGRIFEQIDQIKTVGDMAQAACLSPRQLQRVLGRAMGLAPHDFLKILRLQSALRTGDESSYADQSHFIRSFRSATGYTPGAFARRYDV